jgi:serine/threonine-protein kinase
MGLVFSAWDARLQRDVAIKLLRDEYATPEMRSRFLQEARAASGLNHPNICTIFDIGEQGGDPYLVMELLKGETLRARIASGIISPEDVIRVATEVADALTVAHTRGIIHRDIKPANIILVDKPGGRFGTKVLDFGLAKVDLGDGMDRFDLTSMGSTVGTVSYMSPEQARGEPLDARSDIFSLGVVLYEMATGLVPFRGATSALVFVQLLSQAPEAVREQNAAIPKELEHVILKCLEKDRALRYQSAAELVEALHNIQERGSSAGRPAWDSDAGKPAPIEGEVPESSQRPAMADSMMRPLRWTEVSAKPPRPAPPGSSSQYPSVSPLLSQVGSSSSKPAPLSTTTGAPLVVTRTPPPRSSPRLLPDPSQEIHAGVEEAGLQEQTPRIPMDVRKVYPWMLAGIVLAVGAVTAWLFWPTHAPPGNQATSLVLTSLANNSADTTLTGALNAALKFDLEQSTRFAVRDASTFAASERALGLPGGNQPSMQQIRQAAQAVGATHVLLGEVHKEGSLYVVSVKLADISNGHVDVSATQTAASREQLPDAIDRLALEIRRGLGESGDAVSRTSVPLSKEASSNLDALNDFYTGETLMNSGGSASYVAAMAAFVNAWAADSHFPQAQMALAEMFRRQRAPKSAAQAAQLAVDAATTASERTRLLAQASYALDGSGNIPRAAALLQQVLATYPADVQATVQLATAQRTEGLFAEAVETSQRVLRLDPYDDGASGAEEAALLAQGQIDLARQKEAVIRKAGGGHPGIRVLINFLGSRDNGEVGVDLSDVPDRFAAGQIQAQVYDATGLLTAGLGIWYNLASQAESHPELQSAAGEVLSSGALDRALAEDCTTAQAMLHDAISYPMGMTGLFNVGTTSALCGSMDTAQQELDTMQKEYPDSYAVKGYYAPDLLAVIQWKSGNSSAALNTLDIAKQNDLVSLTPYLRGLIHLKSGQSDMAILDFGTTILQHRGAMALTNPVLIPMAQLHLARAYQAKGDQTTSAIEYGKFLQMWNVNSGQDMVREARAGATKQ